MAINFSSFIIEIIKYLPSLKKKKNPWIGMAIGFVFGLCGIKILGLLFNSTPNQNQQDWFLQATKANVYDVLFGIGGIGLSLYLGSFGDFILIYVVSWVIFALIPDQTIVWFAITSGFYGMLRVLLSNKQIDEGIKPIPWMIIRPKKDSAISKQHKIKVISSVDEINRNKVKEQGQGKNNIKIVKP